MDSERLASWSFVGAQAALLVALALLPSSDAWVVPSWVDTVGQVARVVAIAILVVGLVGLGRSLSPFPLPTRAARLKTRGIYGVVRHPIYLGLILLSAVWAATSGNLLTVVAAMTLVVLLIVKSRWEEQRLLDHFEGYRDYAERVGRLLPGVGRVGSDL